MNKSIALLGLPGSGKTYWGCQLATHLDLPFYDLDVLIIKEAGISIKEIFDEGGEVLFRSLETSTLYDICTNKLEENFVLALGGGTPSFNNNINIVNEKCISIYLNISIQSIINQLKSDQHSHRPLLEKADDTTIQNLLEKLLTERKRSYEMANYMLMENEINLANFDRIIKDAS